MHLDRVNFGYSMKNIHILGKQQCMKEFLSKMESFVRRLRWKAFFFDNKTVVEQNNHDNYGFKSERCPPQHKALAHSKTTCTNWQKISSLGK